MKKTHYSNNCGHDVPTASQRLGGYRDATPERCCPHCGDHVEPARDGCQNCDATGGLTPREPFFRVHDNERDMELYDDLFDACAKLSEQGGIDSL